jgi:hypothetical protein
LPAVALRVGRDQQRPAAGADDVLDGAGRGLERALIAKERTDLVASLPQTMAATVREALARARST